MQEVLAGHGVLCFIADQNAGSKGEFGRVLRPAGQHLQVHRPACDPVRLPDCGRLCRRRGDGFRFDIAMQEIIRPEAVARPAGRATLDHPAVSVERSRTSSASNRSSIGGFTAAEEPPADEKPGQRPREAGARIAPQ